MATLTKAEKLADQQRAKEILAQYASDIESGDYLLMITQELGKGLTDYLRVQIVYNNSDGKPSTSHLTWAISKALGYTLRDRNGYHYLAISGYGFSKADEIARSLAFIYGVDRIRYELN